MTNTLINLSDAKDQLPELINRIMQNNERIILTRRGKELAAIISMHDLQLILENQEQADLREALDALKEAREKGSTTLEQLREKIG